MPTETQTPRLESAKMRLIDANALKQVLRDLANATDHPDEFDGIESTIRKLESAPTVDISVIKEKAWMYDSLNK